MNKPNILICTVGTGNVDQSRETLFEPLKKSIRHGHWRRVILLPSQLTKENAARLTEELPDVSIEISELPQVGAEEDADACFAHFDRIITDLRDSGVAPENLLVDFTRGTKAMSAALVLAAIRHELPQLRYVSGGKRDERGMVVPGTEVVAEVRTTVATARKRLDDAYIFMQHGNFAAVLDVLPDFENQTDVTWPHDLEDWAKAVRALAAHHAAWDRLDYLKATQIDLPEPDLTPPPWRVFLPDDEIRQWVTSLAQPLPEGAGERAAKLRLLVADLLANAERRLRDHQYEDAIIRGYRVLELIGQIRLFEHGLDSAELPPEHPDVNAFQQKLIKTKSQPLTERNGKYQASREQVARLLKHLNDPLAKKLLSIGNSSQGTIKLSKRNYSIWIHGFEAIAGSDPAPIRALLNELCSLIILDGGSEAEQRLKYSRWLGFSKPAQ